MWRISRAEAVKVCAYGVGVGAGIFIMVISGVPTALILSAIILLAPIALAAGLRITAFIAFAALSYSLSDNRDRAELLASAISKLMPAGDMYQETMIANIRNARSEQQVRALTLNLITNAPRTVFDAWVRVPRPLWRRWRARR